MANWKLTLTLTLTLKKVKGECFETNLCLNIIFKWTMTFEVIMGVSVKNETFLSRTIFSCAGDRLARKFSSYIES